MNPRHGQERGQDLVEYALVLPLFLFLAFSIIELSLLFFDYVTVSNAAREGARAGIVMASNECNLACVDNLAEAAARDLTVGLIADRLDVFVTHPDTDQVQVEVRYSAPLITGMVIKAVGGSGEVDIVSSATMTREG
jgi:Flp pilus assembly protein TadG